MVIGVLKEPGDEKRVALLPGEVKTIIGMNVAVWIESKAGNQAFESDAAYAEVGATIKERKSILQAADIILQINEIDQNDMAAIPSGKVIMSMLSPLANHELIKFAQAQQLTTFSMDFVPRTTRAQAMDVLSSMASVAGYKAVLKAAEALPHFFPMYITAAGSIKPSKVLILGAGVAGLQAIATARKLGAVVEAFDVRSAVKEEVMSLGAKFVEVEGATEDKAAGGYAVEQTEEFKKKQTQMIQDHAIKSDVVICTAQIPGRRAPLLITKDTVEAMKPGSVIVDMAASTGGNCELTENDVTVVKHEVTIIGDSNLPCSMSVDASFMYGKNMINFLKLIVDKEGNLNLNWEDDIVAGTCITHAGEIKNERVKQVIEANN
ncbi:MAG: Re/Si-specific NAD(P)(+) transhydrogenase subunit alpha [Bacteroidetes bacterium]|nr:Re/Si-specific NAD(P)(+) transhydrogenase subunit alpha [Bacteroidota bacterium]